MADQERWEDIPAVVQIWPRGVGASNGDEFAAECEQFLKDHANDPVSAEGALEQRLKPLAVKQSFLSRWFRRYR